MEVVNVGNLAQEAQSTLVSFYRSRPGHNRSVSPDPIENTQFVFEKEKHMLNRLARAFLCLTIIISATGYCFAQATGNIKGSVADPNGGLVAGATVEAVNNQTGEKRSTQA